MKTRFWQRFYDRFSFAYDAVLALADRLRLGSEGRIRREIIAHLNPPAGSRVLDLGCGTGASRPYLPSDIRYIGVDLSRGMLRRAAVRFPGACLVQADGHALPFAQGSFDVLIAMGVLQHMALLDGAFKEIWRSTQGEGRIVLMDEKHSETRIRKAMNRDNVVRLSLGEYFVLDSRI